MLNLSRSFFDEQTRRRRQTYFFIALGIVWMAIMASLIVDAHAGLLIQLNGKIPLATIRQWCIMSSAIAVGLWVLVALVLLTSASRVLPLLVGAHIAQDMDKQVLGNVAEEIAIAAGESLSGVRWYVLESSDQNAFACGRSVNKGSIVVTRGLLDILNRDELQAVVAHELAHLKNGDSQFIASALAFAWMVIGVSLTACTVLVIAVALMVTAMGLVAKLAKSNESDSDNTAVIIVLGCAMFFIVGIVYLAAYAFMLGLLLGLVAVGVKAASSSISQSREYLADACAAQWTRNPLSLASALVKISDSPQIINAKVNLVSPLWLNLPRAEKTDKVTLRLLSFFLHTHPSIDRRIELLRNMAGSTALTEAQWLAAIRPSTSQRIKEWAIPAAATILSIAVGILLVCDLIQ